MRQFGLQIVCIATAFAYSFFGEVSAEGAHSSDEKANFFSRLIVCRDVKSVLSISDAFRKGEQAGWERFALDFGRAKQYLNASSALDAHVCAYQIVGQGHLVHTLTVSGVKIFFIRNFSFERYPKSVFKHRDAIALGDVYAFRVEKSPPWFDIGK